MRREDRVIESRGAQGRTWNFSKKNVIRQLVSLKTRWKKKEIEKFQIAIRDTKLDLLLVNQILVEHRSDDFTPPGPE